MLLRHATTSPLGLLFTAFEIASLLSSYIPLQVKWCSTRAERKKGEGTGGQKEQRPRQGRRGTGEGQGQGQRSPQVVALKIRQEEEVSGGPRSWLSVLRP